MTAKDLILLVLVFIVLGLIVWLRPVMPSEKGFGDYHLIAHIPERDTWVYEVGECTLAVSQTYGYAVSVSCP